MTFAQRIDFVRALIGKTPDDGVWHVVKSLGELRNQYAHSDYATTKGMAEINRITTEILQHLNNVRPGINLPTSGQDEIITQAHFTVRRFFREINEALDNLSLPRSLPT